MWDTKKGVNIKWKAKFGSVTYGSPIVANDVLFIANKKTLFAIATPKTRAGKKQ